MNNETLSSNIELITENGIQINGLSNVVENQEIHYLVYKITNLVNGKFYIGQHQTKNPYDDYIGSGKLIKRAVKKYGLTCFIKEFLFDFDSFEKMNNKEKELVPLSICYPYNQMSYNLNEGGYNGKKSPEVLKVRVKHFKETWKNKSKEESDIYALKQRNKSIQLWQDEEYRKKWHQTIDNRTIEQKQYTNELKWNTIKNRSIEKQQQVHDNISAANKRSYQKYPNRVKKHSKMMTGKGNPMYGHPVTEFMTDDQIKKWKENISKAVSGEKNGCYGRKWMHLKGSSRKEDRAYVRENEFQKYLDKGYVFGMKEKEF